MGLDITACRRITKLDAIFNEDGDAIDKQTGAPVDYDVRAYANKDFPGRWEGVEDGAIYKAEESIGFCAGSYSGHNAWREELAKLAGYNPAPVNYGFGITLMKHSGGAYSESEGPFWELINFSDCEGTIGPIVSAKLANDFAEWDERAKKHADSDFYAKFQQWMEAFEMAADGGLVGFH